MVTPVVNLIKPFTIVIYESRVVWLENCPYYDSRVVIYACKIFTRLATDERKQTGLFFTLAAWKTNPELFAKYLKPFKIRSNKHFESLSFKNIFDFFHSEIIWFKVSDRSLVASHRQLYLCGYKNVIFWRDG